jgi:hypothetical protein
MVADAAGAAVQQADLATAHDLLQAEQRQHAELLAQFLRREAAQ